MELQSELYGWGGGWAVNTQSMVGMGCAGLRFCAYRTACNACACFIWHWEKEMETKPRLSGAGGREKLRFYFVFQDFRSGLVCKGGGRWCCKFCQPQISLSFLSKADILKKKAKQVLPQLVRSDGQLTDLRLNFSSLRCFYWWQSSGVCVLNSLLLDI